MSVTTDQTEEVLEGEGLADDGTGRDTQPERDAADEPTPSTRTLIAAAFPVVAAAIMVGGVFTGISPRVYAGVSALLGLALALGLARLRGRPILSNALALAGLFTIGLVMLLPHGLDTVTAVRSLVSQAAKEGDVLSPPVQFLDGWKAIVGWLMGIVGFVTGWVALVVRRPSFALLLPLPVAAIAAISVPDEQQVASGIALLVMFAIGLAILSADQGGGEGASLPVGYQIRKALKGLPVLALVTGALALLAQTNLLFPPPLIDPTQEPQRPKTVPLSEVEDRVLFEVDSIISGPWRLGSLDVYDGKDWRLPAFAENELADVPRDGRVDEELQPGVRATFTVAGLGGTVLPGLPNTVGVVARGPRLAYDPRSGNIRLSQGTIEPGLEYTVAAAALPSVDQLRRVVSENPPEVRRFTEMPPAPPAVEELLAQAREAGDNDWDRFDFLRSYVLENVVASGLGTPVSVTPERVQQILGTTLEASPYEIVALQAMLARWAGIPARIGYGYDGGDLVEGKLHVRPRHGASFVEVYFPGFKWLPVTGTPEQAEPTVSNDPELQKVDPNIVPSDDIAIQLFFPVLVPPRSTIVQQVLIVLGIAAAIALFVLTIYTLYPLVKKARVRSRRRAAAAEAGPRARVALAYAEWRDLAGDFGFSYPTDTPLMFLDRFVEDDEHTELAWLTTRALWGDLRDHCTPQIASAAEELSRSLRRRLATSQPSTLRLVAALSRLSLRDPFAPDTDLSRRRNGRRNGSRRNGHDARGDETRAHAEKEAGDAVPVG